MKEGYSVRRAPEGNVSDFDFTRRADFTFHSEHKSLGVKFYYSEERNSMVAETFIRNNILDEHAPGLTTTIYGEARMLMQEAADLLGKPILYLFETQNERMKHWAKDPDKGQGLFEWDEFFEIGKILFGRKNIIPQVGQ